MKPLIPVFFGTLVFFALIYYLLPAPFLLAGGPAWFLLLVINPLACLISAILHPFIAGIAFIPTLYLYYNDSALVYLAFYVITAVMGIGIGWTIYLKK